MLNMNCVFCLARGILLLPVRTVLSRSSTDRDTGTMKSYKEGEGESAFT